MIHQIRYLVSEYVAPVILTVLALAGLVVATASVVGAPVSARPAPATRWEVRDVRVFNQTDRTNLNILLSSGWEPYAAYYEIESASWRGCPACSNDIPVNGVPHHVLRRKKGG